VILAVVVTGSLRYWQTKERYSFWMGSTTNKGKQVPVKPNNKVLKKKKFSAKHGSGEEEGRVVENDNDNDDDDDDDDLSRHTGLGGRLLLGIIEWPLEREKKYEPGAAFSVLARKTYLQFYDKVLPYTNLSTVSKDKLRQQQQQQQQQHQQQIGRHDHPVVCSWGYFWKKHYQDKNLDGNDNGSVSTCHIVYTFVIGSDSASSSQQSYYHYHGGSNSSSSKSSPSDAVVNTFLPESMQDDVTYLSSSVYSENRNSTIQMLERLKLDWFRSVIDDTEQQHPQQQQEDPFIELETIFSHIATTDSCAVIYPHLLWPHVPLNTGKKYIATDPTGRYLSFSTNLLRPFVTNLISTSEEDNGKNNTDKTKNDLGEDLDSRSVLPTLNDIFYSVGKGTNFRQAETILLLLLPHGHMSNQTTNHLTQYDTSTTQFQLLTEGFEPLWAKSDPVDFEGKWETYKDDLVIYEPLYVESTLHNSSSIEENNASLPDDVLVPNRANGIPTSINYRRRPKILLSIFTMDSPLEAERRSTIRRTYLSYFQRRYNNDTLEQDTICSLPSALNNTHLWERCQLVYVFVIGGNASAPEDMVNTFNRNNFDQQPLRVESFPLLEEPASLDGRREMENDDIVFLNLKENMNDGKSQSWFLYATQLASERNMIFDYIAKMDSDTLFVPDVFMDTCFRHLPIFPNNAQIFGGNRMIVKKNSDAIDLLAPHYYQGSFYILSWDMARFITSVDCNRTMLDRYGARRQFSEDKSIGNFVFSHPKPIRRLPAACNQRKTKWYYHPLKDPTEFTAFWHEAISQKNQTKTIL